MNWRAVLIVLVALLAINVITAWPMMDPGFPFSLYGSREDFGRSPVTAVVFNALFALVAALVVGVAARRLPRSGSASPIHEDTHCPDDFAKRPRSDHEYIRLSALHRDGRCVPIMIGVSYGDPVYFSVKFLETEEQFSCEAPDAFSALCAAREKYEPLGWRFLCNGSRRDCYAFDAQLKADLGEQVYQLRMGKAATKDELVGLFEPADEAAVGTLEEQSAYFERWQNERRK
ncbi:MAG: hypothetical protein K9J42_07915 [Sulfuritalea sp.]|nr:hypothetical protein [Sulfuritalea sp.]